MIVHGQFTPNSVGQETLMVPGWNGGAEYGGSAFDPATDVLYVNANEEALTETLVKGTKEPAAGQSTRVNAPLVTARTGLAFPLSFLR